MKLLVPAGSAQPRAGAGREGSRGDPQWHAGVDPASAEAQAREACHLGHVLTAWS